MEQIRKEIETLRSLKNTMHLKDYLLTWDLSDNDVRAVYHAARALELMYNNNIDCRVFATGLAVSNFRDNSTRTRFSFASAATLLGLTPSDLDEGKSQLSHGETVRETANMISFLTEVVGIRDDLFIHEGHEYQMMVAKALQQGYEEKVLHQRPIVVNLQCDRDHPTQSMADLMHIASLYGGLENLKGKKIAMTWAYSPSYGKPLSVPQAIINLLPRFGMEVVLAHPEGYDLLPDLVEEAGKQAKNGGGSFKVVKDMKEAFQGADIVYPKSWAPFWVMEKRVKILRSGDKDTKEQLAALEKQCLENNAQHKDWTCTEEMMKVTKDGKAHYMHCLPADITGLSCKEGEVEESVFERYRVETYQEASHKPFVIAASILLGRFQDAPAVLDKLAENKKPRVFTV